jgi:hypothetical protein
MVEIAKSFGPSNLLFMYSFDGWRKKCARGVERVLAPAPVHVQETKEAAARKTDGVIDAAYVDCVDEKKAA